MDKTDEELALLVPTEQVVSLPVHLDSNLTEAVPREHCTDCRHFCSSFSIFYLKTGMENITIFLKISKISHIFDIYPIFIFVTRFIIYDITMY